MDVAMPEILGNKENPRAFLKFEFWGSWGYKPKVEEAIAAIEESENAGSLQYHLYEDKVKTGRHEVNMYNDAACSGAGVLVHSKLESKKHPVQDEEMKGIFLNMIKTELENMGAWTTSSNSQIGICWKLRIFWI